VTLRSSLSRSALAATAVTLVATARVDAGVLYTIDLGAQGLGQGGAFIAAPDDGSAAWYNPAALATQRGLRLDLDAGLSYSRLSFDQAAAGGEIDSRDGFLPVALLGASYHLARHRLTVGGFVYVPSSSSFLFDPKGQQNFQGIGGHYQLVFAHAAIAYRVTDQIAVGATVGASYFHATQYNSISIAKAPNDPYDPFWAVLVTTDVSSSPFLTANFGVQYLPAPCWAIGVSFMPPFRISANGTLKLSSPLVDAVGQVDGDRVAAQLDFPAIARAGVRWAIRDDLAVELAAVYEGWHRLSAIHLQPSITVAAPTLGIAPLAIPPIDVQKSYRDVVSVRAGGALRRGRWTLRAGAYVETAGSLPALIDITAPEATKIGTTIGATVALRRGLDLDVAFAHVFYSDVTVTNTQLQILNVVEPTNTGPIGDGTYHTAMDFLQLALRYTR
jgi:long-subunit fatty acid transport protein